MKYKIIIILIIIILLIFIVMKKTNILGKAVDTKSKVKLETNFGIIII